MQTSRIEIEGMHCASCVGRVEKAIKAVPGVSAAAVNLATASARVEYSTPATLTMITEGIAATGFHPRQDVTRLEVKGMHCASCIGRIERALTSVDGFISAQANLATNSVQVAHLQGITRPALVEALSAAGYTVNPETAAKVHEPASHAHGQPDDFQRRFLVALLLTLPIFVLEMGGHAVPAFHRWVMETIGTRTSWMLQFVLTTAVLAFPGREFFRIGLPTLLRRAPEMNSLVALGAAAAWGYSTIVTFAPALIPETSRHVYFEAAAVIVTLILLGRWLEARAKGRAGEAIGRLLALRAPTARRLGADGRAEDVSVDDLRKGDHILIRPGERIAADGEVTEGASWVDEAMLTGEPAPVQKLPGQAVTGGTINGNAGALTIRVTRTGAESTLSRIIALVEEAQAAKLPIQALVDRVTMWFVPAVIGVAVLTFVGWLIFSATLAQAVIAAVSVLIIACPCAMGLATPVSILVGTGRGAELGILYRRGDALQQMEAIRVFAFDKTGTLTEGKPRLVDSWTDGNPRDMLRLAAAVEARSEHPIAHAILLAAKDAALALPEVADFNAHSGQGVSALVEGHQIRLGSLKFVTGATPAPAEAVDALDRFAQAASTPVVLGIDGHVRAAFAIADRVKPDARATVAALKMRGLQVAMVTGDNRHTAEAVGRDLDIDTVEAEVLPGSKAQVVKALRDRFGPVAFVGDGINDAPALAEADLGLAIGGGTDVAIEAADVVLVSGDPAGVVRAHELSRATMRNIRQNLFWAFAYNILLIPVAAGLLVPFGGPMLSPLLAAAAMALSSVFVVTNALRLRRAGKEQTR